MNDTHMAPNSSPSWNYIFQGLDWETPDFNCGGQACHCRQSPIDINTTKIIRSEKPEPIKLLYSSSLTNYSIVFRHGQQLVPMTLPGTDTDNAEDHLRAIIKSGGLGGVVYRGHAYQVIQAHFHTPAEHTLDGKPQSEPPKGELSRDEIVKYDSMYTRRDLELHIVHKRCSSDPAERLEDLLVVGITFSSSDGSSSPVPLSVLTSLWDPARRERATGSPINFRGILLQQPIHDLYSYSGSLTTPPISSGVRWCLLPEAYSVGKEDFKVLQASLAPEGTRGNYRVLHNSALVQHFQGDLTVLRGTIE